MAMPAPAPAIEVATALSVAYGDHPRHRFDIAVPARAHGALVVIAANGWGDAVRQEARAAMLAIAEQGWACAVCDLRGQNQTRDAEDLVRDLRAGAAKALEESLVMGADDHGVVLLGVGGAAWVALSAATHWPTARDHKTPRLRGLIAFGAPGSGDPAQLVGAAVAAARFLAPLGDPRTIDPLALPPCLLVHADNDGDAPIKLVRELHQRIAQAGRPCHLHVTATARPFDSIHLRSGADTLGAVLAFLADSASARPAIPLFSGRLPDSTPETHHAHQ